MNKIHLKNGGYNFIIVHKYNQKTQTYFRKNVQIKPNKANLLEIHTFLSYPHI